MTRGFKIFLLTLLLYLGFWVYQLRETDIATIVTSLHDPATIREARRNAPPPEASPANRVVVIWKEPEPVRSRPERRAPAPEARPRRSPERRAGGTVPPPRPRPVLATDLSSGDGDFSRRRVEGVDEAAPPGAVLEHVVEEGESAWKIARKLLGSGTLCGELLEFNGLTKDDTLHAGMRLRIPPSLRKASPGKPATPRRPPARSGPKVHTVARGDSLAILARRYYRDPEKWAVIYDANSDTLDDPHRLSVGMEIRIP